MSTLLGSQRRIPITEFLGLVWWLIPSVVGPGVGILVTWPGGALLLLPTNGQVGFLTLIPSPCSPPAVLPDKLNPAPLGSTPDTHT